MKMINLTKETKALKMAVEKDLSVLLVGDAGTGKNALIYSVAKSGKNTNEVLRFSITGETTVDDFVGRYNLVDGNTIWTDGVLLQAMKQGHWLVVDEINAAAPEILFILHSLLDDDKSIMLSQHNGDKIHPHENFRFFATMNPPFEYAGTKELNKALLSRFGIVIEFKPPSKEMVKSIVLSRNSKLNDTSADKLAICYEQIRQARERIEIGYAISLRDVIHAAELIGSKNDVTTLATAVYLSIVTKSMEDKETVQEIVDKIIESSPDRVMTIEELNAEIDRLEKLRKEGLATLEDIKKGVATGKENIETLKEMQSQLMKEIEDFKNLVINAESIKQMYASQQTALDKLFKIASEKDLSKKSLGDIRNLFSELEIAVVDVNATRPVIQESIDVLSASVEKINARGDSFVKELLEKQSDAKRDAFLEGTEAPKEVVDLAEMPF